MALILRKNDTALTEDFRGYIFKNWTIWTFVLFNTWNQYWITFLQYFNFSMKHLKNFSRVLICIKRSCVIYKFKLKVLLKSITWNNQRSFVKQPNLIDMYITITLYMYIISVHSVMTNWKSFFGFKPMLGQKILQIVNKSVLVCTSG